MLAPHLTPENGEELLAAATHRTKAEIERLVAERFPRPDLPERVEALAAPPPALAMTSQHAPGRVEQFVPERAEDRTPQKLAPLSPQRYALQTTVDQETYDLLRHAQTLLGHQCSSGDIAPVLTRALKLLVCHLERRKLGAATRARRGARRSSANPRHIPAAVRCAVWKRDEGQCTFRSEKGHRCPARAGLEFDHVEPVARGGRATVDNLRLRCRAHNQYDAERAFGAGFMQRKREQAQAATAEAREAATAAKRKQAADEVIPYLRTLGFRADESRAAAALCEPIPEASLEQRVKLALSYFANRHCTRWRPAIVEAPPMRASGAATA
jgi:5-methylcytosine-specific restriction endonuclease McrA